MGHGLLPVLMGGGHERVHGGLVVVGARAAYDDLDVVRALGDPVGHELPGLVRALDLRPLVGDEHPGVQTARRQGRQARAAQPGKPGHAAQRIHQGRRGVSHVEHGGHAEAGQPLQRAPVAHVHVGVDQPGQQHAAVPVGDRGPRRIGTDPIALDDHRPGRPQLPPVEHAHVGQGDLPGRARPGRTWFRAGHTVSSVRFRPGPRSPVARWPVLRWPVLRWPVTRPRSICAASRARQAMCWSGRTSRNSPPHG